MFFPHFCTLQLYTFVANFFEQLKNFFLAKKLTEDDVQSHKRSAQARGHYLQEEEEADGKK